MKDLNKVCGTVTEINGEIVTVMYAEGDLPNVHELLTSESEEKIRLLVTRVKPNGKVVGLVLSGRELVRRGLAICGTGKRFSAPVGHELLGRVIDIFGNPLDDKGEINCAYREVWRRKKEMKVKSINTTKKIWETGI